MGFHSFPHKPIPSLSCTREWSSSGFSRQHRRCRRQILEHLSATRCCSGGRRTKAEVEEKKAASVPERPEITEFLVYVRVEAAVKRSRKKAPNKRKVETKLFGPISIPTSLSYILFLESIASLIQTTVSHISTDEMKWNFTKPAGALVLLLTTEAGYLALISNLTSPTCTNSQAASIYVTLPQPRASSPLVPWAGTYPQRVSASNTADEDDELEDERPTLKKGQLDGDLYVLVDRIKGHWKIRIAATIRHCVACSIGSPAFILTLINQERCFGLQNAVME